MSQPTHQTEPDETPQDDVNDALTATTTTASTTASSSLCRAITKGAACADIAEVRSRPIAHPATRRSKMTTGSRQWMAVLLIVVCVGVVLAVVRGGRTRADVHVSYYPSVQFMAERIGCLDTLITTPATGAASSSGTCTLPGRVQVALRTYADQATAQAWVDGAKEGRPVGTVGAVGGNWGLVITGTTDRTRVNEILTALP